MPRQTRKKKGGKVVDVSEMDAKKVENMENENENDLSNKSFEGGMDNALENEFSTIIIDN